MSSCKLPGGDKPEDRSVTATDSPATAYPTSSQPHGHILQHPNMHPHASQKSARPIAPAPIMSGSSGTSTLTASGNIPNFISTAGLVSKSSDGRHAMPGAQGPTSSASHSHAASLNSPLVPFAGASSAALTTAALASNQLPSGTLRAQVQQTPLAYSTHIPKGALVTNQLVMRSNQPTPIPISTGTGHLVVGRQSTVIPTIKTGSPANTRASSPAISIPTTQVPVSSEQLRTTMALPVGGQPCPPIQITLRPTAAAEGKSSVGQIQQKLIVTQQPKVVAAPLISPLITANKTVAFPAQSPAGMVVASAGNPVSVASTGSTSIPVAKVPPQRQQQLPVSTVAVSLATSMPTSIAAPQVGSDLVRSEVVSSAGYHTMSSILMQPSRPVNTTTANTTTITIPSRPPQPEVRQDLQQRPNNIPQLSAFNSLSQEGPVWYPQYPLYPIAPAQVQVTTQAPPAPLVQPPTAATTMTQNLSTIIFPPKGPLDSTVQNQGPVLSATLAAAAGLQQQPHAMNLAQPQMRLVAVDTRQPLAVHQINTPNSASIAPSSVGVDPKPLISITSSPRLLPGPGAEVASLGLTSLSSTATVASSIYTSSTTAQTQPPSSSAPSSNPTSSPRPSILRKRFSDGTTVIPKRPNFTMTNESHSPRPETMPISNASSPKTPAGLLCSDNSQSSTDTALSTEGQTNSHLDSRNKHESHDGMENGPSVSTSGSSNTSTAVHNSSAVEESPRKRPRKQLLHINPELKDHTSSEDDPEVKMVDGRDDQAHSSKPEVKDGLTEYIDEEGIRYVSRSPNPKVGLLNFYNQTWKARNNHFTRYADVKKKEERRPTVNELANKRGILQKSSGWKIYCMSAQLEHYVDYERSYCKRLCELQTVLGPKQSSKHSVDDELSSSLYECAQACIQRSRLLTDQTEETIGSMKQILSHKPSITEIIHKHMSKRPIKKKERT